MKNKYQTIGTKLGLAAVLTLTANLSHGAFDLPPNTDLSISCYSNGLNVFGNLEPALKNKTIKLIFEPHQKQKGKPTEFYELTVKTSHSFEPQKETVETGIVKMNFIEHGDFEGFIALTGPKFDHSTGRFTSYEFPTELNHPFLLYGYSSIPKTVSAEAIEYRCKVEGVHWDSN